MQRRQQNKKGDGAYRNERKKNTATVRHADRHPHSSTDTGNQIRIRASGGYKSFANPVSVQLNAENIPTSCFQTVNSFFDIEIVGSDAVDYMDHLILQLQLRNPDLVNPLTLGHFFQLWDKIELLPDGSNVQDTLYPEMMYLMYMQNVTDEYRSQINGNYGANQATARPINSDPRHFTNYDSANAGAGVIIPPGGSYTYFSEIPCIMQHMDLYLPALRSNKWPRIRFYPSVGNARQTNSTSVMQPVIQQALFVVHGPQYVDSIRKQLKNAYRKAPSISAGITMERQIINYNPVSGVESADIVLNSCVGKYMGMYMILRDTSVFGEELFSAGTLPNATWHQMDTITFKEGGGRVVSYEKQPVVLFNTVHWANYYKSNLAREKAFIFYSFASDPCAAIYSGADTGSFMMTSKESVRVTPVSVTGNAFVNNDPMEFLVYGFRYSQATQANGIFSIDKL